MDPGTSHSETQDLTLVLAHPYHEYFCGSHLCKDQSIKIVPGVRHGRRVDGTLSDRGKER